MGDEQLLGYFIEGHSHEAFRRLVERHAPAVYASALRQVHSHHLAEDVTQAVFISLALKASSLQQRASLGGWLLKVTRYAAIDALRRQNARSRHERASAQARPEVDEASLSPTEQKVLALALDDALSRLTDTDRSMVAMRFFERLTLAQIGHRLGMNAESVRKRVERALKRLREHLERRRAVPTTVAIAAGIAAIFEASVSPARAAIVSMTSHALRPMPSPALRSNAQHIAAASLSRLRLPAVSVGIAAGFLLLLTSIAGVACLSRSPLAERALTHDRPLESSQPPEAVSR